MTVSGQVHVDSHLIWTPYPIVSSSYPDYWLSNVFWFYHKWSWLAHVYNFSLSESAQMWVQGHSPRAHWEKTQTNGNWTRRTGVASHYPERLTDSHRRSLSDTVYETTTSVWYQRSLLLKVASTHPQPSFVYAAFDSKWFTGIKVQSRISDHSGSHLWAQIILWSVFAHVCAESSVTSYRDYECCTADSRQLDLHSAILMWVSSQQKAQDRREHWEHIEEAMH